jgi:hypothetical protein
VNNNVIQLSLEGAATAAICTEYFNVQIKFCISPHILLYSVFYINWLALVIGLKFTSCDVRIGFLNCI